MRVAQLRRQLRIAGIDARGFQSGFDRGVGLPDRPMGMVRINRPDRASIYCMRGLNPLHFGVESLGFFSQC